MTRLVLDTSAYSHFRRGVEDVVALISSASWIGMTAIVLGELHAGFGLGKRRARNEAELAAFLSNSVVHELDVDHEAAQIYAQIVLALRAAGRPIPTNDIWIAAVAAREGVNVVTYDEHFASIARVGTHVLRSSPPTMPGDDER
jgi:predicted nucleic acid-binding protein